MTALEKYYEIVNFRLANPLSDDVYVEKHHIKPKSIYPDLKNDQSNIVKLLPEEHYKCHQLLPEIYKEANDEEAYEKMLYAWHFMAVTRSDLPIDEQAKEYARLIREFRKVQSKAFSGKNNPMYGKHHSAESKQKMSKALSGKKYHPMLQNILQERTKSFLKFEKLYTVAKIHTLFKDNYEDYFSALTRYNDEREHFKTTLSKIPVKQHEKNFSDMAKFNSCFVKAKYIQMIFGNYPGLVKRIPYTKIIAQLIANKILSVTHHNGVGFTLNKNGKQRNAFATHYELRHDIIKKAFDDGEVDDILDLESDRYTLREKKLFMKIFILMRKDNEKRESDKSNAEIEEVIEDTYGEQVR